MDRRNFLYKSAVITAGCLLGAGSFSEAFAFGGKKGGYFSKPRIALIIDDIGNSRTQAERFLKLDVPLTFSILPRLRRSQSLALEIHNEGHDVMLHQPMEPYNRHLDPGPGALYVGDKITTISRIVDDNISDVPFAIGVNNHMGSKFTSCENEITETLKAIKERNLFFIDSLTSHHSKAYGTAQRLHMTTTRRNIFLDNSRDETCIHFQLQKLTRYARRYGHAVGIGHPFRATAKAIGDFIQDNRASDVSLVHVSDILNA